MKVIVNIPDGEDAKGLYISVDNSNAETILCGTLELEDGSTYILEPSSGKGWTTEVTK